MAIIQDSVLMQCINGTINKEVTIYQRGGKTIMAKKRSASKKKPTQNQLEARYKMRVAAAYAMSILADPDMKAYYQSKAGPGQNAYNMAIRDAYNSPEIQSLTLEADTVVVRTTDEFRVDSIQVEVLDANGETIERGQATMGWNGMKWTYKVAQLPKTGRIRITAVDLPGNETIRELLLE